jgi:preprotein translocase subunit SecB
MSDQNVLDNGAQDPNAPQFSPQVVYIKDVSYEAPAGPRLPNNAGNPTINMNLNTAVNELAPDLKEVVLTVNVQAVSGDRTLWLCEVQQAGAFVVRNIPQTDVQRLLAVFCPNYLLPYARQTISDLLIKGGFPPFLVPPVNFDALLDQAAAQAAQSPPANSPNLN